MANTIKLKRSSVQGKIPEITSLELGEAAINTYDGKFFIKQDNGIESIVEIGSNDFQTISVQNSETITAIKKADNLIITKNVFSEYNNTILTSDSETNTIDFSISDTPKVLQLFFDITGSSTTEIGQMCWNVNAYTIDVNLGHGVIGQMFQEIHCPLVKNLTGITIPDGTPVVTIGVDIDDIPYVAPFIADGSYEPRKYLGVTTEPILPGELGVVTHFGRISGLNTSAFSAGDTVYASPFIAGELTNIKPSTPNFLVEVGCVIKSDVSHGILQVRRTTIFKASEIPYDNTDTSLIATNVQSALNELYLTKASVDLLSSNITLYRTTAPSTEVPGYFKLVSSTNDPDYNSTAVDVSTGPITTTNQLLSSYIAEPGLFIGNPGVITITTIANVMKTFGNSQQYGDFYFELYRRDASGIETLVSKSGSTGPINPLILNTYFEYTASAILNDGFWLETDRIIIKSYGNLIGNSGAVYNFQFGGINPMRNLLPVPVAVIPSDAADKILVDTSNFENILTTDDNNVQASLETIDSNAVKNTITIATSSGLTGGGDLSQSRTISHADTSNVSNLSISFGKSVNSLTFDDFGHVTNYTVSTRNTSAIISGSTPTVDVTAHSIYTLLMSGVTTVSFSNIPLTGTLCEVSIIVTSNGSDLIWTDPILWENNTEPTLSAGDIGFFTFKTINGGLLWFGSIKKFLN